MDSDRGKQGDVIFLNTLLRKHLSPQSFNIFGMLMFHQGKFFSASEILSRLWADGSELSIQNVRVRIGEIRKVIEENPKSPKILIKRNGFGYLVNDEMPAKFAEHHASTVVGGLIYNSEYRRAVLNGVELILTPIEFDVLGALLSHRSTPRKAENILWAIGKMDSKEKVVTQGVEGLRRAMGKDAIITSGGHAGVPLSYKLAL